MTNAALIEIIKKDDPDAEVLMEQIINGVTFISLERVKQARADIMGFVTMKENLIPICIDAMSEEVTKAEIEGLQQALLVLDVMIAESEGKE